MFGLLLDHIHREAMGAVTSLYVQHMRCEFKQLLRARKSSGDEAMGTQSESALELQTELEPQCVDSSLSAENTAL